MFLLGGLGTISILRCLQLEGEGVTVIQAKGVVLSPNEASTTGSTKGQRTVPPCDEASAESGVSSGQKALRWPSGQMRFGLRNTCWPRRRSHLPADLEERQSMDFLRGRHMIYMIGFMPHEPSFKGISLRAH